MLRVLCPLNVLSMAEKQDIQETEWGGRHLYAAWDLAETATVLARHWKR